MWQINMISHNFVTNLWWKWWSIKNLWLNKDVINFSLVFFFEKAKFMTEIRFLSQNFQQDKFYFFKKRTATEANTIPYIYNVVFEYQQLCDCRNFIHKINFVTNSSITILVNMRVNMYYMCCCIYLYIFIYIVRIKNLYVILLSFNLYLSIVPFT